LRRALTPAEFALWTRIRGRQLGGFKFVRQEPIDRYYVDFVCRERRLIIELDGGQHSERPEDRQPGAETYEGGQDPDEVIASAPAGDANAEGEADPSKLYERRLAASIAPGFEHAAMK